MMVFIVYYVIDCIVYVLLERKMVLGSEWMKELYIRNWFYLVVKFNFLIIYDFFVSYMNI